MFASTFVVTAIGTFVTDKIVEPRLGKYEGAIEGESNNLTAAEKRGLKFAGIAALIYICLLYTSPGPRSPLWPSTAPPFRTHCWKASCSATRRAPCLLYTSRCV